MPSPASRRRHSFILIQSTLILLMIGAIASAQTIVLSDNMKELRCAPPSDAFRQIGSGAPGQVFVGDEPISLRFALKRGEHKAGVDVGFAIEIQEIGTRTPGRVVPEMEGWTDTAGHAPLLDLIGSPVRHEFAVEFTNALEAEVALTDVPTPKRFGTFAIILDHVGERHFLCTVARVPTPRPNGTIETVPIFGEGQFLDLPWKAKVYARMGIRGWRSELGWSEDADGKYSWERYDALFAGAKDAGCKIMVTLGAHPSWTWPLAPFQTPAAVEPNWDGNPYSGKADWLADPKFYSRYEKWIAEFCKRYGDSGVGALWGLENYNEPWEGGGISGWARDCLQYREIQKTIARAARSVPNIRLLAASSIMNTEEKFYSDGSRDFDAYVDIFTDHYVIPRNCYGPMVAKAHGKTSMETETWFVGSEYQLAQAVVQFLASGQDRIAPWHPRVLFEAVPGGTEETIIPSPLVTASAAFNYFVTGKHFEKIVFFDHLPWVFQFGKDDDADALLVMFGQLIGIGSDDPTDRLWPQVDGASGGEMIVDNADGLLQFFDLAGNPTHVGEKSVTIPLNIYPTYIKCTRGAKAAAERLAQVKISGKRPVEILPRDFDTRLTGKSAVLNVSVHNCLNRTIRGKLNVTAPVEVTLAGASQDIELPAGEARSLSFAVASAKPQESNAYPFAFHFKSDAGDADYAETLNVAVAPRASIAVDGTLDDWRDIPGVTIAGADNKIDQAELLRRPWLEIKESHPTLISCRFKMAWDDANLYVSAEVNDPTDQKDRIRLATRDENHYFHSAADDEIEPFKSWLSKAKVGDKSLKELGHSFAEAPYVYARSPEVGLHFRRDRLQIGLDVTDDWHDLAPDTDKVPRGFHAVPDTDYEYSLYACDDGGSELWRHLAPGVPRIHDMPRQPRGAITTGAVANAKHVVKRIGSVYIYEMAIPRSEIATLKLQKGTSLGLVFKAGNGDGPSIESGVGKAACKGNGLSLHPYWEPHRNCGVRWTLVE